MRHRLVLVREEAPAPYGAVLHKPADVGEAARLMLGEEAVEVVLVFFLDSSHAIRGYLELSRGGISKAMVDVRVVFAAALLAGAVGVIVVHNHPSGRLDESADDLALCRRLRRAAATLDLELVDFVIVGSSGVNSGHDRGWLS